MNVWFGLGIGVVVASPLIALLFGVFMLGFNKKHDEDWYVVGVGGCFVLCFLFLIVGSCERSNSNVTLYNIEIRVHYVDGYSKVIRRDSITELPSIKEYYCHSHYRHSHPTGTYSLYIEDEKIPGVVRFEYLKKRQYQVPYSEAYK